MWETSAGEVENDKVKIIRRKWARKIPLWLTFIGPPCIYYFVRMYLINCVYYVTDQWKTGRLRSCSDEGCRNRSEDHSVEAVITWHPSWWHLSLCEPNPTFSICLTHILQFFLVHSCICFHIFQLRRFPVCWSRMTVTYYDFQIRSLWLLYYYLCQIKR